LSSDLPDVLPADPEVPSDSAVKPLVSNGSTQESRVTLPLDGVKHIRPHSYDHSRMGVKGKRSRLVSSKVNPEVRDRIRALRKRLGLDQIPFAQLLGLTQSAVSKWERGLAEPSAEVYGKLSRLCKDDEEARFFKERLMGSSPELLRMVDEMSQKKGSNIPRQKFTPEEVTSETVAIPLLKDAAAAGLPRLIQEREIAEKLLLPRKWFPDAQAVRCIRVKGDSMSPILEDDYIVAIDTTQADPRKLVGQMVAAGDPEGGVTVKWLRRTGSNLILVPQHTSVRHNPVVLEPGWRIIGRVLFWIGKPK
jgi:SOS-response transcriptional repressor LexA